MGHKSQNTKAILMTFPFNKYNAKRVNHSGYSFASKGEAALFDSLKFLEKIGEIKDIQVQDHVHLTKSRILSIPDFKVIDTKTELPIWYEFKGFETDVWRIKRRLWKNYGPGLLKIFKMRSKGPSLDEEILPHGDTNDETGNCKCMALLQSALPGAIFEQVRKVLSVRDCDV